MYMYIVVKPVEFFIKMSLRNSPSHWFLL